MSRLDPSGQWREQAVQKKIAAGRYGEIEEHANLACYLLSDYANWVTGSVSDACVFADNSLSVCD